MDDKHVIRPAEDAHGCEALHRIERELLVQRRARGERRIREELSGTSAVIEDVLGEPVKFFRAPHGARRPAVLRAAREMGMRPVQWNLICGDWNPVGVDKLFIMGHSAGSMAVSELVASPLTKGLFRAAIGESGADFAPPGTLSPTP